jgi:hypothetical protein
MRSARGWLCIADPDAGTQEADTSTCAHCQRITVIKAGADPATLGGYCRQCDALVCQRCVGGDCLPFLKQIEAMEERYYRRRQLEQLL